MNLNLLQTARYMGISLQSLCTLLLSEKINYSMKLGSVTVSKQDVDDYLQSHDTIRTEDIHRTTGARLCIRA